MHSRCFPVGGDYRGCALTRQLPPGWRAGSSYHPFTQLDLEKRFRLSSVNVASPIGFKPATFSSPALFSTLLYAAEQPRYLVTRARPPRPAVRGLWRGEAGLPRGAGRTAAHTLRGMALEGVFLKTPARPTGVCHGRVSHGGEGAAGSAMAVDAPNKRARLGQRMWLVRRCPVVTLPLPMSLWS